MNNVASFLDQHGSSLPLPWNLGSNLIVEYLFYFNLIVPYQHKTKLFLNKRVSQDCSMLHCNSKLDIYFWTLPGPQVITRVMLFCWCSVVLRNPQESSGIPRNPLSPAGICGGLRSTDIMLASPPLGDHHDQAHDGHHITTIAITMWGWFFICFTHNTHYIMTITFSCLQMWVEGGSSSFHLWWPLHHHHHPSHSQLWDGLFFVLFCSQQLPHHHPLLSLINMRSGW